MNIGQIKLLSWLAAGLLTDEELAMLLSPDDPARQD